MKNLSIKYQLIIMIFAISLVSLCVATATFVLYDRYTYKESMVQELTILARIVASRSANTLVNNDPEQATQTLDALGVKNSIIFACLTTKRGEVFATFSRTHSQGKETSHRTNDSIQCLHDQGFIAQFSSGSLDLVQPVLWKESQKVGELHIREDLSSLNKRVEVFSVVILLIVLLSSVVAIVLSSRIQSYVSTPILSLIDFTTRVARQKDYSLRARKFRDDELGKLVEALNTMLDTLEAQNRALLEMRDNLEQQIEEGTVELRTINRELEAFTYSVSHDLRAPLRSVEGFSVALIEDCGHQLNEAGRDYLQRIRTASLRMGTLIDSLLYLSRVSRQDVIFQAVDLAPLADDVVARLREHYQANPVHFVCSKTLLAFGDKTLLMILLDNLLGNAWKYSVKVNRPHVELGVVERNGEPVYFVRDNGVGFDMKFADKLFGPFQRLHRAEDFEGLGVGLATVARIVHRHGGEIWAEGIVGVGAVFYFTLDGKH